MAEQDNFDAINDPVYVGFWMRTLAALVDSVIFVLIAIPLLWQIYGSDYFLAEQEHEGTLDLIISYGLPALAIILFWVYRAATPGKMLIKTEIRDARTGQRPSTGQCIGRYVGYYLAMFPLFLGIIWVAFDKRKQGWHDKIASTVVVYTDK